jgi:hypothetical protein
LTALLLPELDAGCPVLQPGNGLGNRDTSQKLAAKQDITRRIARVAQVARGDGMGDACADGAAGGDDTDAAAERAAIMAEPLLPAPGTPEREAGGRLPPGGGRCAAARRRWPALTTGRPRHRGSL